MKKLILAGATDQTLDVFIQDSSSTTGAGKTGLAYNTASLVCYYRKGATGTPTALSLVTQTVGGAHSDGGFVELDSTNFPGMYRLDLSDTIVATAGTVTLLLKGAANMAPCPIELQVVAVDLNNAASLGLTNLDAAITTRLAPTTAGRTLDVSAAGNAGIDWSNIENPTQAGVTLTGTTIATTQKVDVETIKTQTVTAAAGVTVGAYVGQTGAVLDGTGGKVLLQAAQPGVTIPTVTTLTDLPSIPANWLTAAGIANGAITAAKFGAGAIDAAAIADGAIDAATFAAGAITAAAIATGAIDADALATDAVTELTDAIKALTAADADTLTANTWLDILRRLRWIAQNKLEITDATGAVVVRKDDSTTQALGSGTVTDNSTTTTRTRIS